MQGGEVQKVGEQTFKHAVSLGMGAQRLQSPWLLTV